MPPGGIETEQCDDGAANTDTCPYGQGSCSVCTTQCVQAEVSGPFCGDGSIDGADGEVCDAPNLGGEDCNTQTAGASPFGTLACAADCLSFDTSGCTAQANVQPVWPVNAGAWNSRVHITAALYAGEDPDAIPDSPCVIDTTGNSYYFVEELETTPPDGYTCFEGWRFKEWTTDAYGEDCNLQGVTLDVGSGALTKCVPENGGIRVQFRVTGQLSDFIDASDPSTPAWRPNAVTLLHTTQPNVTSPSSVWWTNPVEVYSGSSDGTDNPGTNPVVVVTDNSPSGTGQIFLEDLSFVNLSSGAIDFGGEVFITNNVWFEGAYAHMGVTDYLRVSGSLNTLQSVTVTDSMGAPFSSQVTIQGDAWGTTVRELSANGGEYSGDPEQLLTVGNLSAGVSGIFLKNLGTISPYGDNGLSSNVAISLQGPSTPGNWGGGLPSIYLRSTTIQGGLRITGQGTRVDFSSFDGSLVFDGLNGATPGSMGNIFNVSTFGGAYLDGAGPYAPTVIADTQIKLDDGADQASFPPNTIFALVYIEEADFDGDGNLPQAAVNIPPGAMVQGMSVNLGTGDGQDQVVSTSANDPYGPKISALWVHNAESIASADKKLLVPSQGAAVTGAQEVHVWNSAFIQKGTAAPVGETFRWEATQGFVGGKLFVDRANSGNSCSNVFASDANYTMLQDGTCTAKNTAQLSVFDYVSTTPLLTLTDWPEMPAYASGLTGSEAYIYQAVPPPGTVCGDGLVGPGEQCDDGGQNTGSCDIDCTNPACGDGVFNPQAEDCDPSSASPNCSASCTFTASFLSGCGDGSVDILDPVDQCDDNNIVSGDGCSATCQNEVCGNYRVDVDDTPCMMDAECLGIGPERCDLGTNVCVLEECDDGPNGSLFCTPSCFLSPQAGQTREVEHVFHDSAVYANQADCDRYFTGAVWDGSVNGCRTYVLIGAYESIGDKDANLQPIGNDNGLCESGET
ncbi:MAG: hypothetical protein ACPHRO_03525, partial [Nannocystaceae bacterium]